MAAAAGGLVDGLFNAQQEEAAIRVCESRDFLKYLVLCLISRFLTVLPWVSLSLGVG